MGRGRSGAGLGGGELRPAARSRAAAGQKSFPTTGTSPRRGALHGGGHVHAAAGGGGDPAAGRPLRGLPTGEEGAHQLINNSGATAALCFSPCRTPRSCYELRQIAVSNRGRSRLTHEVEDAQDPAGQPELTTSTRSEGEREEWWGGWSSALSKLSRRCEARMPPWRIPKTACRRGFSTESIAILRAFENPWRTRSGRSTKAT
jgi:hypothetical protein